MTRHALVEVPIAPLPLDRFGTVLDDEGYRDLLALQRRAAELISGQVVWCVNSTAQGGGVAEMLRSLLAYTRGAGVDSRWSVLQGTPGFFAITKRLHNRLHGELGDGGPLGDAERAEYEAVTAAGARELARLVRPGDVVILHDPQTAGMAPALRDTGAHLVWRLHVGADEGNGLLHEAVQFLHPYVDAADLWVFSRRRFVWDSLDPSRAIVVAPSIDVFSAKNQPLDATTTEAMLRVAGVLEPGPTDAARFLREDGTPARVNRSATLIQERPLRAGERYVAQVSRWDRLKDPLGVLEGFARRAEQWDGAHLLLAGPAVDGVADDPEAATVLEQVTLARQRLPAALREQVHLVSLPMADAEENAAIVNAIQRRAAVVVQKSLAEGFGLTVTEAMWKARPLVVSRVGGIQEQVTDGVEGLTVDPCDLTGFGAAVGRLLTDAALAEQLAASAHERARELFLQPRHLHQWVDIIDRVSRGTLAGVTGA
jgi:trehalose synthase